LILLFDLGINLSMEGNRARYFDLRLFGNWGIIDLSPIGYHIPGTNPDL
jgi:hypothetical protein